jgi:pepF/M3 family oligoendopeptidase
METKWSLENIYSSPSGEQFKADVAEFTSQLKSLNAWAKTAFVPENDVERVLCEYLIMKNRLMQYDKLTIYVSLALAVDTANEELSSALDLLDRLSADCAEHEALFCGYLKTIDAGLLEELISHNTILSEHAYFLRESKRDSEHTLAPEQEIIISKLKNTGSSLWEKQWEQLTSNLEISFECNGKSYKEPLSGVRNMAYSPDKELRLAAYRAELAAYEDIKTPAAFCMNGIKGEVITVSKLRGYSSPLSMTVEQSRISEDILNTMWSAIKEYLPNLSRYFTAKAALLGYKDNKLPFYELFAPVGKDKEYSLEDAKKTVVDAFTSFSEEMGAFAENAFEKRWIDLLPRKGKTGGAFCESVHAVKESRIMTNFSGSFNDVVTIAHELGHAYHDSKLYDATPLNSFYPMPIAETASTLCETILINYVLEDADKDEALVILENDLSGIMQTLSDIYSRFLFEDEVFRARQSGTLSADSLCKAMLKAQREAYSYTLSDKYMHEYMWLCKPHYYDADFNYYNFPYAFGMLLSKALYGKYKEMGADFTHLYDEFLSATATNDLNEVARLAGFDLTDKSFWITALDIINGEIDDFIKLTETKKG